MRVAILVGGGVGYGPDSIRRLPAFCWLTTALAELVELTVITWDGLRPLGRSNANGVVILNLAPGRGLRGRVLRALASLRPDVVHGHFIHPQGQLAVECGLLLGIPSVVSLLGGELSSLPEISYGMLRTSRGRLRLRWILAAATRVTAASHDLASRSAPYGVEAVAIPLGVGPECFVSSRASRGPPWRLIHIGHLTEIKGTPTMLRALARVAAEEPRVHLDAFGIDLLEGKAQRLAAELGIASQVIFHGKQPAAVIAPFLQRAHLHLLPSLDEGGPVSVLEAAAMGVPTVGSRVGHLADWGEARCWPVAPRDDRALAEGILTLLRQPTRRKQLGWVAQHWAREHDAAASARAFVDLYRDLA